MDPSVGICVCFSVCMRSCISDFMRTVDVTWGQFSQLLIASHSLFLLSSSGLTSRLTVMYSTGIAVTSRCHITEGCGYTSHIEQHTTGSTSSTREGSKTLPQSTLLVTLMGRLHGRRLNQTCSSHMSDRTDTLLFNQCSCLHRLGKVTACITLVQAWTWPGA